MQQKFKQMKLLREYRTLGQILLWWAALFLIQLLLLGELRDYERFITINLFTLAGVIVVVSINLRYLLPQLYFKKRKTAFAAAGIVLIFSVSWLSYELVPRFIGNNYKGGERTSLNKEGNRKYDSSQDSFKLKKREAFSKQQHRDSLSYKNRGFRSRSSHRSISATNRLILAILLRMLPYVIVFLGSTLIEVGRFASKKEKQAIQWEKEKLETELKFLKSQINPHFLFNTLNNVYSLTLMQDPKTPESIMQLSEILRYMVYDSNEAEVPLKSEINYIESYVQLKLLKDSRGMDVRLNLDRSAPDLKVAPLLFITFIENAFKHSHIENLKGGYIAIDLQIAGREVIFKVDNSVPQRTFTKDKVGGVGLENIRKRLNLLYPEGKHILEIKKEDDSFSVYLKLNLA